MRILSALCLSAALCGALSAQAAQPGAPVVRDLCLVEYGPDLGVRDALIEAGAFYGDLGEAGIARIDALRFAALIADDVPVAILREPDLGEVLVVTARDSAGNAPILGRVLLARPTFFVTAARPEQLPFDRSRSGFHGGFQLVSLDRPYVPVRAPTFGAQRILSDPQIAALVAQVQQANLQADVTALSAIYTRRTTQPENAQGIAFVTTRLATLPNVTWRTETFNSSYGPNVIAELPGTDLANEIVMVGGHIDSLVGGGATVRAPGADDNASGSAAVLEIARIFAGQRFRRTVRFGWWNAEELGLIGSAAYAAAAAGRGDRIVAYVNADMTAYRAANDTLSVDFVSNDSTPALIAALTQATYTYVPGLQVNVGPLGGGTSDHRSFFQNGFPAAFPFEDIGQYSPYIHSSNDTVGLSANDFQLATMITQSILAGVAEIAEPAVANPGSFQVFGQGCAGTGSIPSVCASNNPNGGALTNTTRTNEYAYVVPNTGAAQVTSFEFFTQSTTGGNVTVGAYLYADAGGQPAATPLASTTITVGSTPAFYTATLPAPVNVSGTFYLSIDHSAQTTYLATLTSGSGGSGFYRRPPLTGTWGASTLITAPSFKVHCGGGRTNVTPDIGADGVALIGRTFDLTLEHAAPGAVTALVLGISDQAVGGAALPLPIPGAPGCDLLVSTERLDQATSDPTGACRVTINVPNVSGLIGRDVFHQWVVIDPGANPIGLAFTAGGRSRIGG